MSFYSQLKVLFGWSRIIAILGAIIWILTLVFYSLALSEVVHKDRGDEIFAFEEGLWSFAVGAHVLVGLLVYFDATQPGLGGKKWPLQWLIMTLAGSITALVATGFATALMRHGSQVGFDRNMSLLEDPRVSYAGASIITALAGDALLLSVLFAYFHKKLEKLEKLEQVQTINTRVTYLKKNHVLKGYY